MHDAALLMIGATRATHVHSDLPHSTKKFTPCCARGSGVRQAAGSRAIATRLLLYVPQLFRLCACTDCFVLGVGVHAHATTSGWTVDAC